jgi:hypothetical protein
MATQADQFIVDEKGNRTGVVLSWRRYRKLMEDLHDLTIVAQRRHEKSAPLAQFKRRLTEDGIL